MSGRPPPPQVSPGVLPFPPDPLQVLNRANTHLRMVKQGLRDMADPDQDRVLLGFFGIVVFGRSVTLALQHLRTFDRQAFDEWYEPWFKEMRDDPLCKFFYQLRTDTLHGMSPLIGFVLASSGGRVPPVGAITIPDRPSPTVHRGQPTGDTAMRHLCGLYVAYLEDVVNSASSVILAVQDRWQSSQNV